MAPEKIADGGDRARSCSQFTTYFLRWLMHVTMHCSTQISPSIKTQHSIAALMEPKKSLGDLELAKHVVISKAAFEFDFLMQSTSVSRPEELIMAIHLVLTRWTRDISSIFVPSKTDHDRFVRRCFPL